MKAHRPQNILLLSLLLRISSAKVRANFKPKGRHSFCFDTKQNKPIRSLIWKPKKCVKGLTFVWTDNNSTPPIDKHPNIITRFVLYHSQVKYNGYYVEIVPNQSTSVGQFGTISTWQLFHFHLGFIIYHTVVSLIPQ